MSATQYEYFSQNPNFPAKTIIGILFLAAFLGYLNETLLNVALSRLMVEFSVERATVQWLTTGFLLIMGVVTPISASVMQWFSTRRLALATLGIFALGSLICATAPNFAMLVVGRVIQAIAAAFSFPLLMNAILAIYPPEQRGRAMSLVVVIFTVAPAVGPTLSGLILQYADWHFLFWLPFSLAVLAFGLVFCFLKQNLTTITRPRIDVLSVLLSFIGFGSLVFVSSQFSSLQAVEIVAFSAISVVAIALFARRQLRLDTPLLNLRILAKAQFRYAVILVSMAFFLFMGFELLLPMYSQQVLLFSSLITGFVLLPASLAEAVFAPIFGTILDKKGGRPVALSGAMFMLFASVGLWYFASTDTSPVLIAVLFALFAVGVSSAITCETHGLNHLAKDENPHGTAIIAAITPIMGALGAAFFVGLSNVGEAFSSQSDAKLAMLDGISLVFGVVALLCVGSVFLASRFRTEYALGNAAQHKDAQGE